MDGVCGRANRQQVEYHQLVVGTPPGSQEPCFRLPAVTDEFLIRASPAVGEQPLEISAMVERLRKRLNFGILKILADKKRAGQ